MIMVVVVVVVVVVLFLVMEHWWNKIDGKTKILRENLSQCHFVHKSHVD
jgi:uncharacterized membrane protein